MMTRLNIFQIIDHSYLDSEVFYICHEEYWRDSDFIDIRHISTQNTNEPIDLVVMFDGLVSRCLKGLTKLEIVR